jgi:Domain of Unknown Function (DUF1080)
MNLQWRISFGLFFMLLGISSLGGVNSQEPAKQAKDEKKPGEVKSEWTPLFNGKDLTNWKKSGFAGEGDVEVVEGAIVLHTGGGRITGITFTKEFPKTNFEIHLEARRVSGSDFFCGLTFPVADSHASLICGGWGGSVTGISSIDGSDASENSSSKYLKYDNGKWYDIRMRVTPKKIEAWIDGTQEIDVELEDHRISTRIEVDRSKPLGISAFESKSEIRKFEWKVVKPEGAK